jgi:hypothetical protein
MAKTIDNPILEMAIGQCLQMPSEAAVHKTPQGGEIGGKRRAGKQTLGFERIVEILAALHNATLTLTHLEVSSKQLLHELQNPTTGRCQEPMWPHIKGESLV